MNTRVHVPVIVVVPRKSIGIGRGRHAERQLKIFAGKRMGGLEASLTRTLTVRPELKPD
jgi:hypothetical protein